MKNLELPSRAKALYYLKFTLFILFTPLLAAIWLGLALVLPFVAALVLVGEYFKGSSMKKEVVQSKETYLAILSDYWKTFKPKDTTAPLQIEGFPLNMFDGAAWLAEVRHLNTPGERGGVRDLSFEETLINAMRTKFPEQHDRLFRKPPINTTAEQLINTIIEPEYRKDYKQRLKEIQEDRE